MNTLAVTSPMKQGDPVRRAQQHLRANPFGQDFMQGATVDGVFGPLTGRACIRAKYWLGYATADQKPIYGNMIDGFLSGKTKLPTKNVTARNARLRKAKTKPLRQKALERAKLDLGMKEHPANTNRCPITSRWGLVGPWCAMAVSCWYLDAGSKAFRAGVDYAYVPYVLSSAVQGTRGLAFTSLERVAPGDLVCFDWEQNGVADHIGLFEAWISRGRTFRTVEGNTSVGNDSNGGQVMHRERSVSQVARSQGHLGLVHVGR